MGPEPRKSGGPKGGAPKGGALKGGGPNGAGPERWEPKISRFFFPLPPQFSFFSISFGLFRGILVVFEAPGRSNVHVWSSRAVVCEPRRPGLVGLLAPQLVHGSVQHNTQHTTHNTQHNNNT